MVSFFSLRHWIRAASEGHEGSRLALPPPGSASCPGAQGWNAAHVRDEVLARPLNFALS